jgi:hypothetical protein
MGQVDSEIWVEKSVLNLLGNKYLEITMYGVFHFTFWRWSLGANHNGKWNY